MRLILYYSDRFLNAGYCPEAPSASGPLPPSINLRPSGRGAERSTTANVKFKPPPFGRRLKFIGRGIVVEADVSWLPEETAP